MNKEQLKKGKEIEARMLKLENRLSLWNRSVKVSMIRLILPDTWEEINSDFVNFDVLKSLTISNITQELNQLKEEFEKL